MVAEFAPDARVVHLVRDGRDVTASLVAASGGWGHRWAPRSFADAARVWTSHVTGAREAVVSGLAYLEVRYEDLVEDFDGQTRAACGFIGLEWNEAMRDFAETAKGKDIRSPSAAQVRRGLYEQGVGQWRRYGEQLAPVMPLLQPWVERFGYPAA